MGSPCDVISGQDRYVWTVREGKVHRQNVIFED
jgi:hypothetical protein